jgi:uncharacterized membrane protein YcgQ (UPF0703/DUF1980 family)
MSTPCIKNSLKDNIYFTYFAIMKMTILFLILIISLESLSQDSLNIRFIHRGEELKTIGTLLICVNKVQRPSDKQLDDILGKSIKTDKKTFNSIKKFITNNKFLIKDPKELFTNKEFYEIINADKLASYLGENNFRFFFDELKLFLKKKKLDKKVLSALKYY